MAMIDVASSTFVDALTGLPNRSYFLRRLGEEVRRSTQFGHRLAVIWIALDGLAEVERRLGRHAAADAVRSHAQSLVDNSRNPIVLARFDEHVFAAILPDVTRRQ